MPPSATFLFVAEADSTLAVLAAHLLAIASNDRVRTAAVSPAGAAPAHPILRGLLAENMMPHWYLPPVHDLARLPPRLMAADVAVLLGPGREADVQAAAPLACRAQWTFPPMPRAGAEEAAALFDWRCLYAAVARRMSLLASLSPQALARLSAEAPGASLRMVGL